MKKMLYLIWVVGALLVSFSSTFAQSNRHWDFAPDGFNIPQGQLMQAQFPKEYRLARLDVPALYQELSDAHRRPADAPPLLISIPNPEGSYSEFFISPTTVVADEVAHLYTVKTFKGYAKNSRQVSIRCDISPTGFHAAVFSGDITYVIEPASRSDVNAHIVYYKSDLEVPGFRCGVDDTHRRSGYKPSDSGTPKTPANLRTYRLAIIADATYRTQFGGMTYNATNVLNSFASGINMVNAVYERDLGVHLTLVSNTTCADAVLTDHTDIDEVHTFIATSSGLGSGGFDVGHSLLWANTGGVAYLGVVCNNSLKGGGFSGSNGSVTQLYVDYMAHELGHQFGGDHTFASSECGTSEPNFRYETGEGSTIMAYAGVCGAAPSYQNFSDPYFHAASIGQINTYISSGGTCAAISTPGTGNNAAPTANAQSDFTIPKQTPFILVGAGTDANSDPITFSWEQFNGSGGATTGSPNCNTTTQPLFRFRPPTSNNYRVFPQMSDVLAGNNNTPAWEKLPCVARTLNFRMTARDNNTNWGRTANDNMVVTVADTGPFDVTAPNGGESWATSSTQNVTWTVNGTDAHCINVDVLISTDNGVTYTVLGTFPNNGSASVTMPATTSFTARVLVQCSVGGNFRSASTFFDVSNAVFAILDAGCGSAYWNMTAASAASNTISNTSVGNITQGNSNGAVTMLSATSASSGYTGVSGGNNAAVAARTGALNTGASGSAYFEIAVTPNAGTIFTLNGISFGSRSTSTGPQAYSVRTSADNYATEVAGGTLLNNSTWALQSNTGLSVASGSGTPLTIRIYGHSGTGSPTAGQANWRIDDLTINGCNEPAVTCPTLTSAPPTAVVTNSSCAPGCNTTAGSITAPASPCPTGSTIQYSTDNFATAPLASPPAYSASAITIYTRCSCDATPATVSPTSQVMTAPAPCVPPTVAPITGTLSVNTCAGTNTTQLASTTLGGTWSSATPAVATVDGAGLVTALSAGTSVISYSVTSNSCTTTETATVTVTACTPTPCGQLFISEYVEGSSNNKYIEVYNPTNAAITLTGNYSLLQYNNGATTPAATIPLTGTIPAFGTFIIANTSAALAGVTPNQTSGSLNFNGDDAIALVQGTTVLDVFGQIGFDPGVEWGTGTSTTLNNTLVRKPNVTFGDNNGSDAFDPSLQWTGLGVDIATNLGSHISDCACPNLSAAAPLAVVTNSSCAPGCNTTAGSITAPASPCPTGSTIQYSTDNFATAPLASPPAYSASAITVYTRCSCDATPATVSPTSQVTTAPNPCVPPTVAPITGTLSVTTCAGATTTLSSATPGGTWSSGTPTVATINASGVVTGVMAGSSVISYSVTSNNCTTTETATVTVTACPPLCPTLTSAPGEVQITNSACGTDCTVSAGNIAAPTTGCPTGSSIQYNVNGGGWTTNLPTYAAGLTIQTRCLCDTDANTFGPASTGVTTAPGTCVTPAAPTGTLDITNSTCTACAVSGGSIALGTVSGTGGTLEYSTDGGQNWSATLPTYNQTGQAQTIIASVLGANGCRSNTTQVGQTTPGTCVTPDAPTGALDITNSTCTACAVSGGSIALGTVSGTGGTLEYSTDGGQNWSATLPTYNQTGPAQTIIASVLGANGCRSNTATVGTTAPGACTTPGAPTLVITNNVCPSTPGSISATGCGAGTVVEYATNASGPWSTTAPTYTTTAFTVYARCRNTTTDCVSSTVSEATQPVLCPTPCGNAYWNMTTEPVTTNTVANTSFGDIGRGNNNGTTTLITTASVSSGYLGASGSGNAGAAARIGALNTGANGSAYFEVAVTPDAGTVFTLNGISFGSRSTGTGPLAYSIRTSANNYATEVAGGALLSNSVWALQSNTGLSVASGAGQPLTIRIYGYNGAGSPGAGTANWRIDDLTISGCNDPSLCPALGVAPGEVQITNSTCGTGCTASGGNIAAPTTGCPSGSSIQYSTNGGQSWSTNLPAYNQTGPAQTIQTRCLCDTDANTFSQASAGVTTAPPVCSQPLNITCVNGAVNFNGQSSIALTPAALVQITGGCQIQNITANPASILCTQVGQTVPVTITVTDQGGITSTCTSQITVSGLPCNWQSANVNCNEPANNVAFNTATGQWTITSSDCYYTSPFTADEMVYARRQLCGDGSITALVTGINPLADGWAGVVMRETSDAGAKKAQLMTNLSSLHRREFRIATNGQSFPQQFQSNGRYWLRIVRTGNQFTMYTSPNGTAWYVVGSQSITMQSCIQVGLMVTSSTANGTVTATFSNVGFTQLNPPSVNNSDVQATLGQIEFDVFPNPTSGQLNIDLTQYAGKPVRIEMYSLEGKLLKFTEMDEVQTTVETLDLSQFQRGMYLVRVKSEGLPDATRKVVLNR